MGDDVGLPDVVTPGVADGDGAGDGGAGRRGGIDDDEGAMLGRTRGKDGGSSGKRVPGRAGPEGVGCGRNTTQIEGSAGTVPVTPGCGRPPWPGMAVGPSVGVATGPGTFRDGTVWAVWVSAANMPAAPMATIAIELTPAATSTPTATFTGRAVPLKAAPALEVTPAIPEADAKAGIAELKAIPVIKGKSTDLIAD
ncbi:hypothetical protein M1D51_12800 [Arthrobacter sp. R3-55]